MIDLHNKCKIFFVTIENNGLKAKKGIKSKKINSRYLI